MVATVIRQPLGLSFLCKIARPRPVALAHDQISALVAPLDGQRIQ